VVLLGADIRGEGPKMRRGEKGFHERGRVKKLIDEEKVGALTLLFLIAQRPCLSTFPLDIRRGGVLFHFYF